MWSRIYLSVATVLVTCNYKVASAAQWPYLQIYPPVNETDKTPLYFALVVSSGGQYPSFVVLPGVQIALDFINSEPSILPGYSLH